MTRVFGGKNGKKKAQVTVEDDAIPEDLLNSIPDVDEGGLFVEEEAVALEVEVAPPAVEVHTLLMEARRAMEESFSRELDRVESTFQALVTQMEGRLRGATEQLTYLQQERSALEEQNGAYERRFSQLKQLTQDI